MSENALRVATMILGLLGAVCLSALLATPAPKHAIVKAFVVSALCRCIASVIPPILFQVIPEQLSDLPNHAMTEAFCVADALLLRYLNVAMAAFSVSFTLPLLYLSCKFARRPQYRENNYDQPFYKRTTIALASGPFVWALPIIFAPLPRLRHSLNDVKPMFDQAACTLQDPVSSAVALILAIIPLALATSFSIVFLFFLWHTIKLPLSTHNLGLLDVTRLVRFAVLLVIFIISVTLYSIITASWVKWNDNDHQGGTHLHTLTNISMIWESVTPLLFFLIFAAHEEIFSTWRNWACGFRYFRQARTLRKVNVKRNSVGDGSLLDSSPRQQRESSSWWRRTLRHVKQKASIGSRMDAQSLRSDTWRTGGHFPESTFTAVPQRILQRPTLYHYNPSRTPVNLPPEVPSLLPPPRPVRSRSVSPEEPHPGLERTLINMPSLTAFGGSDSATSLQMLSHDHAVAKKSSRRSKSRPSTGGSSWTTATEAYDDGRSFASAQSL